MYVKTNEPHEKRAKITAQWPGYHSSTWLSFKYWAAPWTLTIPLMKLQSSWALTSKWFSFSSLLSPSNSSICREMWCSLDLTAHIKRVFYDSCLSVRPYVRLSVRPPIRLSLKSTQVLPRIWRSGFVAVYQSWNMFEIDIHFCSITLVRWLLVIVLVCRSL